MRRARRARRAAIFHAVSPSDQDLSFRGLRPWNASEGQIQGAPAAARARRVGRTSVGRSCAKRSGDFDACPARDQLNGVLSFHPWRPASRAADFASQGSRAFGQGAGRRLRSPPCRPFGLVVGRIGLARRRVFAKARPGRSRHRTAWVRRFSRRASDPLNVGLEATFFRFAGARPGATAVPRDQSRKPRPGRSGRKSTSRARRTEPGASGLPACRPASSLSGLPPLPCPRPGRSRDRGRDREPPGLLRAEDGERRC